MKGTELLGQYQAGARDFAGINLVREKLNGIDLCQADFSQAILSETDFSQANLAQTSFYFALPNLSNLTEAILTAAKRRHPNKPIKWIVNKYWKTVGGDNWVFGDQDVSLDKHSSTPILRHTKVRGVASPYDGNTNYWGTRMGRHPELSNTRAKLLKKQKGKCNWCSLHFREVDVIEQDHTISLAAGGKNEFNNFQLLHGHCHDKKTKSDLITIKKHKALKEYQKFIKQFNKSNWKWIDDIPTLVGTHQEPERRGAQ